MGRCGGGGRCLAALGAFRRRATFRLARDRAPERGNDLGDGTVHWFRARVTCPAGTIAPGRYARSATDPVSALPYRRRAVSRTADRQRHPQVQERIVARLRSTPC